jgi:hypothetical protein
MIKVKNVWDPTRPSPHRGQGRMALAHTSP